MREHQRIYSRECMISHPPVYRTEEPVFYRCPVCGSVEVKVQPMASKAQKPDETGCCCGQPLVKLIATPANDAPEHEMKFCIFGGFANNTIRVEVKNGGHPMNETHHIEWIYLRTYQGGQMKYLPPGTESATLFAMANEDAYAFCDREICHMGWEHCLFQCKRGHIAYAYCNQHGLYKLEF